MFQPNIKQQIKQQSALGHTVIIPFLIDRYNPQSVADFGCGVGVFLYMFAKTINTYNYFGFDEYDYGDDLQIHKNHFKQINLSESMQDYNYKFDLTISLEVAEHISNADNFLDTLEHFTNKAVLFSAATPGQGGKDHCNEQPHSYWHKKFEDRGGFRTRDIIRPIIRGVMGIPDYYKNNIFLYERI
jgi:2-polyprenyl-3-methyl-5-hydroxy-6-metoxy-1,4-benzoquinol methylase